MAAIFVSYRRFDSQDVVGRICDRLIHRFSSKQVFKDVDSIPLGVSFPLHIRQLLNKSDIVLVIIGPRWLNSTNEYGQLRLDDPNDFVRLEIEMALRSKMPVIPVLVSNARMPQARELPASMRRLTTRQNIAIRPDPDFNNDMAKLFSGLDHLEKHVGLRSSKRRGLGDSMIVKPRAPGQASDPNLELQKRPGPRRTWRRLLLGLALLTVLAASVGMSWHFFPNLALFRDPGKEKDKDRAKDDKPPDGNEVGPIELGGTAWEDAGWQNDKSILRPRIYIFAADGTLSHSSPSGKSNQIKKGGTWRLDGKDLFFERTARKDKDSPPSRFMEFRGSVIDADTIEGKGTYLAKGTELPMTLKRTSVDDFALAQSISYLEAFDSFSVSSVLAPSAEVAPVYRFQPPRSGFMQMELLLDKSADKDGLEAVFVFCDSDRKVFPPASSGVGSVTLFVHHELAYFVKIIAIVPPGVSQPRPRGFTLSLRYSEKKKDKD